MNLETVLSQKSKETPLSKPEIFDLQKKEDRENVLRLLEEQSVHSVVDDYEEQEKEYFAIQNPELVFTSRFEDAFREYFQGLEKKIPRWRQGRWAYFPWLASLVHILEDETFQTVRMARNRELITKEEQEIFYNATIGIAGLSVGNSIALAIVLQGGGKHIKLADNDSLALSNLNRIRSGIEHLGLKKVVMTARQIYVLNPYARIDVFPEGLTGGNIERFFEGLDVIIDEIDNLGMKYRIREYAKKLRLPLVMAADNADSGVVDIERYDVDPETPFFHGRMGEVSYEQLAGLGKKEIGAMITKHVGMENVPERMRHSLAQIGKTIVSWPQLGGTALLNGSAVAYCVRKILTNQPLITNRAIISFDKLFEPLINCSNRQTKRE